LEEHVASIFRVQVTHWITFFGVVTPSSIEGVIKVSEKRRHIQGRYEWGTSETSITIYKITWPHNPEDPHFHNRENVSFNV
jgi:hypothetical protein